VNPHQRGPCESVGNRLGGAAEGEDGAEKKPGGGPLRAHQTGPSVVGDCWGGVPIT
jgi:hypothetical protein